MSSPAGPGFSSSEARIPIRNLWYMLLYAWDAVHLKSQWKSNIEDSPNLDALLASILANLIEQRMRIGLGRNYRSRSSEIAGVRGRVNFSESLRRMSFPHGRAHCEYQVYSANVPKNQVIRSSMARLVQLGEFGKNQSKAAQLRNRLRHLVRELNEIDMVELTVDFIRREQLQRHDFDYGLMLAICNLLLRRQMPTEEAGFTGLPILDRDAFTLHQVYEAFVAKFYIHHLHDWKVIAQQTLHWPSESGSSFLPIMRPDLTMQHKPTGNLIILDTKFTPHALQNNQWDKKVFQSGHLYQIYAYLKSQEDRSRHHRRATGILLYPTAGRSLTETVMIHGHAIRWETLDLSTHWEQIERQLLKLPRNLNANA